MAATRSSNRPDGLTVAVRLSVPFFDLDSAGVVWHGRYFRYFELARARLLDDIGYGYGEMAASGFIWLERVEAKLLERSLSTM